MFTLDSFSFAAAQVRVRRAGKPVAGQKAETCTPGDLTGFEVELSDQPCLCGGAGIAGNPTLHLDAKGQVIGRSRTTLRQEVEKAQAPCQCRALPPGGPPPP